MQDRLIHRQSSVLMVVDVQSRLMPHIHEGAAAVHNIVRLLRFARIIGLPVVWVEQIKLGETVSPLREELGDGEPFVKSTFSALRCEPLRERLEEIDPTHLVLTGIEAHVCVGQTAIDALQSYGVHVVADATSSRSPSDRDTGLARIRMAGGVVTSTEMVIFELLERAGTDEFREVLDLVR